MKIEDRRSKSERQRGCAHCLFRSSIFDLHTSRRGSVLVLVMTLLGILFVLGVAFLATMNFEADMIASQTQRDRAESRVTAVVDQLGSTLRDGLMSDSRMPFGDPSTALSPTAYAEMPGVQNTFSSIDPYWSSGKDGIPATADDKLAFAAYTDIQGLRHRPFTGPSQTRGFEIDTSIANGAPMDEAPSGLSLRTCVEGPDKDDPCTLPADCSGYACEGPRVLDADGDGIVDSIQVEASLLDFSDAQLAALSARLNPPTNPTGKVYVGMRVIPHGGLVNLNASHPKLIENVLDVPDLRLPPDPDYGYFIHRPTKDQVAYSPLLEEAILRRRVLLPPRTMPPSRLQGDPFRTTDTYNRGNNAGGADMPRQLFHPEPNGGALNGLYETVRNHRYHGFQPDEPFPGLPDPPRLWAVRMEPFTADWADGVTDGYMPEYDRRHLITTIGHDDLIARGGRVSNPAVPGGEEDILTKMTQANQTTSDPDQCPVLLPFEYADYPETIPNECCPADFQCRLNARKGRLQLSLPFLDDRIDEANAMANPADRQAAFDRIFRLIHDTFFLLVRNAARVTTLEGTPCASDVDCTYANAKCGANRLCTVATVPPVPPITFTDCRPPAMSACSIPGSVCRLTDGVCTIQAPYWQDRPCTTNADCMGGVGGGEVCDPAIGLCVDAWTGQTHSQALISRTAAALTANLIDYADADDIPTRIALRSFDFTRGVCTKGPNAGRVCDKDTDCGAGGVCSLGANSAGREFDFDPSPTVKQFEYVYGLERQPYITEVVTYSEDISVPPAPPNIKIKAWAVELFNPYDTAIDATDQYFLYEVNGTNVHEISLDGLMQPNGGANPRPFTVFVTAVDAASRNTVLGPMLHGTSQDLTVGNELSFKNGWTLYLVRRYTYPGNSAPTNIVVDQFEVQGNDIGKDPGVNPGTFSVQRMVKQESPWTATLPKADEVPGASLGDWNTFAPIPPPHPVEVNFADLGSFSRPFKNPTNASDPRNGSVAFPTTGSLLMLMRHANRSFDDRNAPGGTVNDLAFTTRLIGDTKIPAPADATLFAEQAIDNGRMPVFDEPALGTDNNWYSAHHLAPFVTQRGAPGNLDMLPWGQLVFDYFTALPLSNPGPYFGPDKDKVALPDSLPRVDMEGLRVHGRININAAPWKVLAGLPFVPMEKIPLALKARMRKTLGFVSPTAVDPLNPTPAEFIVNDTEAAPIGDSLAQAIVAYRELRPIGGTGNYADGTPLAGTPPSIAYARGWNPMTTAPPPPVPVPLMARRGTGFMTVGELANVRHLGITDPLYRIDSGVIDVDPADNNNENFVDAVAGLVALGDWVTVRSQVFTVYGILRGEEDSTIVDPDPSAPPSLAELRARDADSRALRFQETIDRLPTFLGEPMPSRIGDRTLARYTDVRND